MAKKKVVTKKAAPKSAPGKKVTKAQAIRDYSKANPSAGPTAIVEALGKKGIKVTPPQVSNTLSTAKRKTTKKKGRKSASPNRGEGNVSLQGLLDAKKFAESVGGADNATTLLNALKKLGD